MKTESFMTDVHQHIPGVVVISSISPVVCHECDDFVHGRYVWQWGDDKGEIEIGYAKQQMIDRLKAAGWRVAELVNRPVWLCPECAGTKKYDHPGAPTGW